MLARVQPLLPVAADEEGAGGGGDAAGPGEMELDDRVFGVEVRPELLQRVVRWQLAGRRSGSHATLSRGEVSYSKRKVVRQKRTGSARHGARSAAIFRHGAVAHGPKPRSHAMGLPKRVRRLGMRMALSARAASGDLLVVDGLALAEARSRLLRDSAVQPGPGGTLVIAGAEVDANFARAAQNVAGLDVLPSRGANVYDILRRRRLVLTRDAVAELEGRLR